MEKFVRRIQNKHIKTFLSGFHYQSRIIGLLDIMERKLIHFDTTILTKKSQYCLYRIPSPQMVRF